MTEPLYDPIPPHHAEAEQILLGAILVSPALLRTVADRITPHDFYRHAHRTIYRTMLELDERSDPIDLVTVVTQLRQDRNLDEVGGPVYLAALVDGIPQNVHVGTYADLVKDASLRRQTAEIGHKLAIDVVTQTSSPLQQIALRTSDLLVRLVDIGAGGLMPLSSIFATGIEQIEAVRNRTIPPGLSSGFAGLDGLTGGFQPGELIIIAARTSQGKTAIAMTIALHVSSRATVAFFSLEMSRFSLFQRIVAAESGIDTRRIRTGQLTEEECALIATTVARLGERQLFIDDTATLAVATLRARAHALKSLHGLGLVVVDYLQLVKSAGGFRENRAQEVGRLSRSLKAMAKELAVPVVALSQLNRAPETRSDRKPQLYDLRESGDIENDADTVLLLWRPGLYGAAKGDPNLTEVFVAKQRHGPTGTILLQFCPERVMFRDRVLDAVVMKDFLS